MNQTAVSSETRLSRIAGPVLDEATSALDEATEAHVYHELGRKLPHTTIVSIAHRPGVAAYHDRHLVLVPDGDVMTLQVGAPPGAACAAAG